MIVGYLPPKRIAQTVVLCGCGRSGTLEDIRRHGREFEEVLGVKRAWLGECSCGSSHTISEEEGK